MIGYCLIRYLPFPGVCGSGRLGIAAAGDSTATACRHQGLAKFGLPRRLPRLAGVRRRASVGALVAPSDKHQGQLTSGNGKPTTDERNKRQLFGQFLRLTVRRYRTLLHFAPARCSQNQRVLNFLFSAFEFRTWWQGKRLLDTDIPIGGLSCSIRATRQGTGSAV
jgi:hypothetical protein